MTGLFWRTVLPSMLAFAFSGVYAIVDGFFVGQYLGDAGLAAINLAYPMTALLQAVGTGLGMGGAIHMAIAHGRGDPAAEERYLGNTVALLAVSCVLLMGLLWPLHPQLLRLFGAQGETYVLGEAYIRVILAGTVFQVFATGLAPLFRNLDRAVFAMGTMVGGFVINIVLDYLMIGRWGMGMTGAALATILGQAAASVLGLGMLIYTQRGLPLRRFVPERAAIASIVRTGLSPFGLTLSPNLIIMLVNMAAARVGGAQAVSTYAVVSYVACVINLILQGVGDGSQPLMSRFAGAREPQAVRQVRRLADRTGLAAAAGFAALTVLGRGVFPALFGASETVGMLARGVLVVVAFGYPAIAFVRVTIAYFYSIGRDRAAYVLVYGEPAALAVLVLVLPPVLGLYGVWLAMPLAQLCMAVLAGVFRWRVRGDSP